MVRDCCLEAVRALIPISSPRGRRSRPLKRGATERRAWNERHYRTAGIRLRLRRAEIIRLRPRQAAGFRCPCVVSQGPVLVARM